MKKQRRQLKVYNPFQEESNPQGASNKPDSKAEFLNIISNAQSSQQQQQPNKD